MGAELEIDEIIHAPIRFRICGLLRHTDAIDFAVIRDQLEIQDSSLSKHLKVLADAGYVALQKQSSLARRDARRITWVKLTRSGEEAFDMHVRWLTGIARGEDSPRSSGG